MFSRITGECLMIETCQASKYLEEAFLWETRTTTCGDGLDFLEDK
jgi:hypothetical protein